MSNAPHSASHTSQVATNDGAAPQAEAEADVIDSVAHAAPLILPIVGGVLMFLLAFIAIFMA